MEIFLIDGTFKIKHDYFYLLIKIHAFICNKTFTIFYILSKNKEEKTYNDIFKYLKTKFNLNLSVLITDFVKGFYKDNDFELV